METGPGYMPPFDIGEPIMGSLVGVVTDSRSDNLVVGQTVSCFGPFQTHFIIPASSCSSIPTSSSDSSDFAPSPSLYLGALGGTGITAYFGVLDICRPREGEVRER